MHQKDSSYLLKRDIEPRELLSSIFEPSIDLILIGEDHYKDQHLRNELRLMEEAGKHGRNYQLGIEYLDSKDANLFESCFLNGDKKRIMKEINTIYGLDTAETKKIIPKVEFALDNHKRVVPLSLNERTGIYDNYMKEMHIAGRLNTITTHDVLTLALLGNVHITQPDRKLLPCLSVPKERIALVLQDVSYKSGIENVFGKDRKTFKVNCIL